MFRMREKKGEKHFSAAAISYTFVMVKKVLELLIAIPIVHWMRQG
jgi:hypothetical protein